MKKNNSKNKTANSANSEEDCCKNLVFLPFKVITLQLQNNLTLNLVDTDYHISTYKFK